MRTLTVVSAGGVIVDREGKVALTARRSFKGERQWGLPKGMVEAGEDHASAAARESKEETGLEVQVISTLASIDYWYVQPSPPARVHKFVHYFLMRPVGGDPRLHDRETEEVIFLDPNEALERVSFPSERAVIRAAIEKAGIPEAPPSREIG